MSSSELWDRAGQESRRARDWYALRRLHNVDSLLSRLFTLPFGRAGQQSARAGEMEAIPSGLGLQHGSREGTGRQQPAYHLAQ